MYVFDEGKNCVSFEWEKLWEEVREKWNEIKLFVFGFEFGLWLVYGMCGVLYRDIAYL